MLTHDLGDPLGSTGSWQFGPRRHEHEGRGQANPSERDEPRLTADELWEDPYEPTTCYRVEPELHTGNTQANLSIALNRPAIWGRAVRQRVWHNERNIANVTPTDATLLRVRETAEALTNSSCAASVRCSFSATARNTGNQFQISETRRRGNSLSVGLVTVYPLRATKTKSKPSMHGIFTWAVTDANPESITLTIKANEDGERVDKVAAMRLEGVSRSTIKRWIVDGRVELDGVAVMPKTRVREGAELDITPAPPEVPDLVPQDIPIEVLFEDEYLALIEKPAGLVVHPAPGHPDGTLVNALLHHFNLGEQKGTRPGIVHRLDKDTSGVMVVAKSPRAHEGLVELFSKHDIERAYTAFVWGSFKGSQTFDTMHGRHPGHRKKFTSKTDRGRRAVTHVEAIAELGPATEVRCTLETGRTHQIRVHLSEHGFPLVGDPMYGRTPKDESLRKLANEFGRQALHARLLGFVHPITGTRVQVESTLPEDMERLTISLRA